MFRAVQTEIKTEIKAVQSRVIYKDLGIYEQKLSYWIKIKLVSPSIRKGKRGYHRTSGALWSYLDLLCLNAILDLQAQGLPTQKISQVLKWLKEVGYALGTANILTNGKDVFLRDIDEGDKVIEVLKGQGQYVLLRWSDIVKMCTRVFNEQAVSVLVNDTVGVTRNDYTPVVEEQLEIDFSATPRLKNYF